MIKLKVNVHEYLKQWAGKKTADEMSIDLEISKSTIVSHAIRNGISLVLDCVKEENKKIDDAIAKYADSKTVPEIARLINVPHHRIRSRGYWRGIKFKSYYKTEIKSVKEKNQVAEQYFNEHSRKDWFI